METNPLSGSDSSARATAALADSLSASCGRDSATWWLARLIRLSWWATEAPLTGTPVGVLLSIDERSPEVLRASTQPGPSCEAAELQRCLSSGPEYLGEAIDALRMLGDGAGSRRGPWQIAIGAATLPEGDAARLYLGSLQPDRALDLASEARRLGLLRARLECEAFDLVTRLQAVGSLIGVARTYGRNPRTQLYFAASVPFEPGLARLLIGADNEPPDAWESVSRSSPGPREHGWAVSIDDHGELGHVKLELPGRPAVAMTADVPERVRAMACGARPEVATLSIRMTGGQATLTTYFRFQLDQTVPTQPAKARRTDLPEVRSGLDTAVHGATRQILAAQADSGAWHDFDLPIGSSGPWVTAAVALRLHALPGDFATPQSSGAVARAAAFLEEVRTSGWAYNDRSPIDCDSHAHALLLLASLGRPIESSDVDRLLRFQTDSGGFATFLAPSIDVSNHSWVLAHPDVTPVAAQALSPFRDRDDIARAVRRAADHLTSDLQRGTWPAFWWALDWYTACAWARCAKSLKLPLPAVARPSAMPSSDCDLALLLEYACHAGWLEIAEQAARTLLGRQRPNGLWEPSPILRVTEPHATQPWTGSSSGALFADRGIFSGAVIASALAGYAELLD